MATQEVARILTSVQFATGPDGRRMVVLTASDWEQLMEWLEDVEDQQIVEAALEHLRAGPEQSGAVPLEDALREL